MSKRPEFTRKVRAAIISRADGKCEKCSAALKPSEIEIDHILPCELGGDNSPANAMGLCRVCHAEKTKDDVRRIRKGDRQRDKNSGAVKPKGFAKKEREPKQSTKPALPPRRLYQEVR